MMQSLVLLVLVLLLYFLLRKFKNLLGGGICQTCITVDFCYYI